MSCYTYREVFTLGKTKNRHKSTDDETSHIQMGLKTPFIGDLGFSLKLVQIAAEA